MALPGAFAPVYCPRAIPAERLSTGSRSGAAARRQGDLVTFGHIGAFEGYVAQAQIDRTSRTGVIVLRSASGGKLNLAGLTFGALAELTKK